MRWSRVRSPPGPFFLSFFFLFFWWCCFIMKYWYSTETLLNDVLNDIFKMKMKDNKKKLEMHDQVNSFSSTSADFNITWWIWSNPLSTENNRRIKTEWTIGIEPTTIGSAVQRSTTELHPLHYSLINTIFISFHLWSLMFHFHFINNIFSVELSTQKEWY